VDEGISGFHFQADDAASLGNRLIELLLRDGEIEWLSSTVLKAETSKNPDAERRYESEVLLSLATDTIARAGPEPGRMVPGAVSMASVEHMTDEQFERYALELLQRELGADGFARFLRLNRSGKGNYTLNRMQWQKDLSVADIVASLDRPGGQ
jgi:hypothetical protein